MVKGTTMSSDQLMDRVLVIVYQMCAIGGAMWVTHYLFVACLNYTAERQVLRIRKEFFRAVLRQDLAWYDTTTTFETSSTPFTAITDGSECCPPTSICSSRKRINLRR